MTAATERTVGVRIRILGEWRSDRLAYGMGAVAIFLAIWQVVGTFGIVSPQYISSPSDAASAGWAMVTSGELWANSQRSLYTFAVGFAISIMVGTPLGLAMGWNPTLRQLTEPPIMALYVTPRLALLPVLVVWLGIGAVSTIAVVFVGAVVPVIVNAMAGIRGVDAKMIQVARSFGTSRFDLFRKVLLPASTPSLLTGVRLGIGRAVLGVVVAEMYAATHGIGRLVTNYGQAYRTDFIVFLVVLVGVFGYVISAIVRMLEGRVERWRGA